MISDGKDLDAVYQVAALQGVLSRGGRPPARGIQAYGVIRGRPARARVVQPTGDQPHYHVLLTTTDGESFDVAVNVRSIDGTEDLYLVRAPITPPEPAAWLALPSGPTTIGPAGPGGLGVDYLRQHLATREQMSPLLIPPGATAGGLNDEISALVDRAIADPSAEVFAFGKLYASATSGRPNPVFGFSPDSGIHDIHLNQGNPTGSNGVYQDGALFAYFPSGDRWEAAFFAFGDQSFQTDDTTGAPIP